MTEDRKFTRARGIVRASWLKRLWMAVEIACGGVIAMDMEIDGVEVSGARVVFDLSITPPWEAWQSARRLPRMEARS